MRPLSVIVLITAASGLDALAQAPIPDDAAPIERSTLDERGALVPPAIVEGAQMDYPPDALLEGVAGDVVMDLDIDDEGLVRRVAVKSSPDPRLSWSALGAVTNMSFIAAQQGGQPVDVRIEYVLTFTIDAVLRERMLEEEEARVLAETPASAPVNLRGRVLVSGERLVVPGAFVSIDGSELEAVTGADGSFELRGVKEGARTIRVEAGGFLPGFLVEDVRPNFATTIDVFLEKRPGAPDETVVWEKRTQREVTKRVLTHQELTRVPGTFGDAIRVVQRLPGVSRAPFGLGAVLIRGGAPEDSVILIDGHLTRILFHLGAGPSVINTDLVERLELYPGGQGARYGRAIAGAVDVVTRDPRTDTYAGKATVDLLNTSFRLEGPLAFDPRDAAVGTPPKAGFFLAGRRSYVAEVLNIGDVIAQVADTGLNGLTLAPRYSDYQAKLIYKLPANQVVTVALFGSHDDLDLALDPSSLGPNAPSNVGITVGFHRLNSVWRWSSVDKNDDGTPKLRAWISPLAETNYSENRFDASQFRLNVVRGSLRAEVELRPTSGFGLVIGTDDTTARFASFTDVPIVLPDERLFPRPATSDPPRTLLDDVVVGASYSVYAESDVRLGPLLVVAGGRADLWTYYDQLRPAFDPRLAMRLDVLHHVVFKGSLGLYHQTASPFELANEFGNPDLPLEQGWQASAGAEVQLSRTLDIDAQLFARTAFDMAEFVVSPIAFFATGAPRIQAIGEQRVIGAELLLRQRLDTLVAPSGSPLGGFFGWVAYTLMKAEERSDAPVDVENAEAFRWTPSTFDQTHILSIATSWQTPALPAVGSLELGAAVRYVTGNPTTAAQGGLFDADTSGHRRYNGAYNATRLPPFFQLDVRVDKRWTFDTWALAAFCDLQNATNNQNFELLQYNYDFTQVEGFPGLPIIPVVGVEASF
jgi:TonB family protein